MTTQVDVYFDNIAKLAEQAVATQDPPPQRPAPVFDAQQDAAATAWTALAVHPLSVLETEYVNVVQAAERRGGNDADQARENAFEAMSQFFSLSSDAPSRLQPDTAPLIDDRLKNLQAHFDLVQAMQRDAADGTYDALKSAVGDAAELIALITDAQDLDHAGAGVRDAARYLGMFAGAPGAAADRWAEQHDDPESVADYVQEVGQNLIDPLRAPGNAVASARSLYNIAPFYLFRLMHRFQGGDQAAPMDLNSKGAASGAATKAMHRADWDWLTGWHEDQVVELKTRLQALNDRLKAALGVGEDVIRFFLKGGRAMYTALGAPQQGENDWDTGILINPSLPPEAWYEAFAAVNDLVVAFLDQARFGYTALLNRHAGDLNAPQMAARARPMTDADDLKDYSRYALLAEHSQELAVANGTAGLPAAFAANLGPAAAAAARERSRPVGVNGELIDVGISKRNSVELSEHWLDVGIADQPGVTRDGIPVPTLPYFVDDFSTIIREALANNTADRKLAKRLVRLKLVLDSQDDLLARRVQDALRVSQRALPRGSRAFGAGGDATVDRLKAWVLAAVIRSLPDAWTRPDWLAALDDHLSAQAESLLDDAAIAPIWQQVEGRIAEDDQATCRELLAVQNAASTLSRQLVHDEITMAQAIGGPDTAQVPLWQGVRSAIEAVLALNSDTHSGMFYVTGGLAGRMQTAQAAQHPNDLLSICCDGRVELLYRPYRVQSAWAFRPLPQRLNMVLARAGLEAELVSRDSNPAVVVRGTTAVRNLAVAPTKPVLITIQQETAGAASARILDFVDGWPIASTRDLVRLFVERAAHSQDYDLRQGRKKSAEFLLSDVLGRQLR
ncbi:MAG: hypothetical protein ACP5DX_04400 [Paracoccaceae bacterium]